jgi:glycine/D-amino acid oxidase-like deaminating enzyme
MSAPSFWLDQIEARPTRSSLEGPRGADVCIVGGGFTGLWTAYELKRAQPNLEVIVLEAEYVGFGASGRNGGWVLGKVSGSTAAWRRRGSRDAPRAMARAINTAVAEVGSVVAREGVDCDWHQGGSLTVAQSPAQLKRLRRELEAKREELGDAAASVELLGADGLVARVAVHDGVGALYTRTARVCSPPSWSRD